MDRKKVVDLLIKVKSGALSVDEAFRRLNWLPYEDLGFAKVDHHRRLRTGYPEVVFCQGKTPQQIKKIFLSLYGRERSILLTRCDAGVAAMLRRLKRGCVYDPLSRTLTVSRGKQKMEGLVSVVSAGTADIPVAEEAAVTAELFGSRVERLYDVGVAGLHRLLDRFRSISGSRCIVAVAGMEGALASVLGGLASCPVIAVPTSVGYGANFQGIAPLLTMLNCCAPGVTVVNVNNGFGAGYTASMINRNASDLRQTG